MNMLIKTALLICVVTLQACSTQMKTPSGSKYKIDVGCTEDMQQYKVMREEVTGKTQDKVKAEDIKIECSGSESSP